MFDQRHVLVGLAQSRAPPSELIAPSLNPATIAHRRAVANENRDSLHSLPKISRGPLRRLVCRLNRNFEPHLLQPLDVVALHLATLKSVEIVWAEILIAGLVFF